MSFPLCLAEAGQDDRFSRPTKSMAELFGHAAAHAPHPIQAAASIARSAMVFGIGRAFASGSGAAAFSDKPARLDDAIKSTSINSQVAHRPEKGAALNGSMVMTSS